LKYRLMDLLACPACKKFPLKLTVYEVETYPEREFKISRCELYCAYLGKEVKDVEKTPCEECIKREIVGGLLECESCGTWYPIYDGIPIMLIGDLRDRDLERQFAKKYAEKLPKYVIEEVLGGEEG